jgi:hypothetical protein
VCGSKRYVATVTGCFEDVLEKQTFYGQRVFKFKFTQLHTHTHTQANDESMGLILRVRLAAISSVQW